MKRILWTGLAALALAAGCGRDAGEVDEAGEAGSQQTVDLRQEAQRIQAGMTEAQVVEMLGKPKTRVKEAEGERLTFWAYDDRQQVSARVYVSIDAEGKVVNVETIPL